MDLFSYPSSVVSNMAKSLIDDVNNYQETRNQIEELKNALHHNINKKQHLEKILEYERRRYEILTEKQKILHKEVNQRRAAQEKYMKDTELLKDNLENHLQHVKEAISKYTTNLGIHLHINSVVERVYQVQVSFFTDKKSDKYYFVSEWNKHDNKFKLLEVKPQPKEFLKLCKYLQETNEMHQVMYWIRRYFKYCMENK